MQKEYLLLRNNQQSGPYTLEEVKELLLQPRDLIWIIGQSAGWRYPEEIPALHTVVEIKNESSVASPLLPVFFEQPVVAANRVYVSMPTGTEPVTNKIEVPNKMAEPDLSFEERVEKMKQRISSLDSRAAANDGAIAEVKYSRSLEDIKTEYADWLQHQKRKKNFFKRNSLVGIGTIIVLLIAGSFWAAKRFYTATDLPAFVQHETTNSSEGPQEQPTEDSLTSSLPVSRTGSVVMGYTAKKNDITADVSNKMQDEAVTVQVPVDNIALLTQSKEAEPLVTKEHSSIQPQTMAGAQKEEPTANLAKQLHISADYLPSPKQKGIGGLAVTIKNNSTQTLKVVAVDVIYFKDAFTEITRKTLYFSNVSPGIAQTLKTPANKMAEGAYAQLGLISSEGGNLFYASNK